MKSKNLYAMFLLVSFTAVARAQSLREHRNELSVGLKYTAAHAGLTTGSSSFWMQGGGVDLAGTFWHGLGAVADVEGMHTADTGHTVPLNLVIATFGPRYTVRRNRTQIFGQVLAGEANGFRGLFPSPGASTSSANSFAVKAGGGLDIQVKGHLAVRLFQAEWLRTQLPNSTNNVQNNLLLHAGFVFHWE